MQVTRDASLYLDHKLFVQDPDGSLILTDDVELLMRNVGRLLVITTVGLGALATMSAAIAVAVALVIRHD